MSSTSHILRLGARGSMLSRMQSQMVADSLEKLHPGLKIELVIIKTTGDQIQDKPLHEVGGKGLFTKELEQALLAGQVDFAVHSYKDVPVTMPLVDVSDLVIAAVPKREDPRDALICHTGRKIADLPQKARVGTGSLRRRCQILALRPDLQVELIRGNIDTRVRKQKSGEFDAVVLAMAGLRRSGLFDDQLMAAIEPEEMLPAAAQAALAIQCRKNDTATRGILSKLDSPADAACVNLERAVVQALNGDCHSPIAANATLVDGQMVLKVAVGRKGGHPPVIHATANGEDALRAVLQQLENQQVQSLLHGD